MVLCLSCFWPENRFYRTKLIGISGIVRPKLIIIRVLVRTILIGISAFIRIKLISMNSLMQEV